MPRWASCTLDAPDDAATVRASDGRTWPDLPTALAALAAEGWRPIAATRGDGHLRLTLRRP